MRWLYYKLYGNITNESKQLFAFTEDGKRNIEAIERELGRFREKHGQRLHGFFVFRHWQDNQEWPPLYDNAVIPDKYYGEFLRVRFRVEDSDYQWAFDTFQAEVIAALQGDSSLGGTATEACLKGWRFYEGYDARDDLGARYGNLAQGVDPTEPIVALVSACTELRFYLLAHPEFVPDHNVVHLYYNTMGLLTPDELHALEGRVARLRRSIDRTIAL
jgi:hypothetical protein